MFIGGHFHTLDDKGRVVIPPRFRNSLGERFIMTKGLHGCLWILKEDRWAVIQQRLQTESLNKELVVLQRFLSGGASECFPDSQGRVLVRYSGTQPMCRVMIEAATQEAADRLAESIAAEIRKVIGV